MTKSKKHGSQRGGESTKQITASLKRKRNRNRRATTIAVVLLIALTLFITSDWFKTPGGKVSKEYEPPFKKEGVLTFLSGKTGQEIKTIDIEIAEDDYERGLGLMYRKSMPENNGMLFIMENFEPQSFWMKDTYISLDIIYLDNDLKIVTIQKHTEPLTTTSVPSHRNAKYVVEVVAGFCDKYKITEEDRIAYQRVTTEGE